MGTNLSINSGFKHKPKKSSKKKLTKVLQSVSQRKRYFLIPDTSLEILRIAENGNVKEFERIVNGNPTKLKVCNNEGRTVAHQASLKNQVDILKIILKHGGSLASVDNDGNTPLHIAVGAEALDAINFLLQTTLVNAAMLNRRMQAPIHLAAEAGKAESLRCLGKYVGSPVAIDVDQPGEHGRTALHLACIHNRFECVKILIEELKASPYRRSSQGYLPLHEVFSFTREGTQFHLYVYLERSS